MYIVTNLNKSVLYTGFTKDLPQRLKEHFDNRGKEKTFAGRYFCYNLVYYEWHQYVLNAIGREKEIKNFSRLKKEELISSVNPNWEFLNREVCGVWPPNYEGRFLDSFDESNDCWWEGLVPPAE